jgi:hypothetical protein
MGQAELFFTDSFPFVELCRIDPTSDRQMVGRGSQLLAMGDVVDADCCAVAN